MFASEVETTCRIVRQSEFAKPMLNPSSNQRLSRLKETSRKTPERAAMAIAAHAAQLILLTDGLNLDRSAMFNAMQKGSPENFSQTFLARVLKKDRRRTKLTQSTLSIPMGPGSHPNRAHKHRIGTYQPAANPLNLRREATARR